MKALLGYELLQTLSAFVLNKLVKTHSVSLIPLG